MVKSMKRNTIGDISKRKVTFSGNPWTQTLPSSNKKRKVIKRRNSWPPDSPRKLNTRKKYQQRFKSRDFPEPFWTDTYEWLVMNFSPESVRPAPIARLTEFNDLITVRTLLPQSSLPYASCVETWSPNAEKASTKNTARGFKSSDTVGFYFVKSQRKSPSNDPKKYLRRLKERCLFENPQPLIVQDLNPTNFNEVMSDYPSSAPQCSERGFTHPIPITSNDARANLDEVSSGKYIVDYDTSYFNDFTENYNHYPSPSVLPRSSLRPLQSDNFEVLGDVVGYSSTSAVHGSTAVMKNKAPMKEIVWNKENIKTSNKMAFPDAKFPNPIEKPKHLVSSQANKKDSKNNNPFQSGNKISSPERNPASFGISSERRFNKLPKGINDRNRDLPRHAPRDMPDPNVEKTGYSKADTSKPSHSQQERSSASSHFPQTSESSVPPEASSVSHPGQSSRPYLRQLFEKDIQSNFSKSKVKSKDTGVEEEKDKLKDDKKKDDSSKQTSLPPDAPIPAEVVGFSFLQSLKERAEYEEPAKDAAFPASVIGHAFLSALLEQQSKPEEKETEKVIPASVIGQAFLKNLTLGSEQSLGGVSTPQPKDDLIPSSVVGQAFLKTLMESSQGIVEPEKPKPIPSSVVSQAFLKSILEESPPSETVAPPPIPSNVIGQSFLKNLIEQSAAPQNVSEKSSTATTDPIPAAVLGQSFLKSLLQDVTVEEEPRKEAIPASVVEQAFLKTLLDSQIPVSEGEAPKPIPSSVLGQAFLKTLMESTPTEPIKSESSESVLPATVIGQTFLKALVEQSPVTKDSPSKKSGDGTASPIPAPVIGQTFLKSLMEVDQPKTVADMKKPAEIPAAVLGSAFIKTLVEQERMSSPENPPKPIPSAVVGQAFLKSLVEHESSSQEPVSSPIPSSVVGQAFLKTLVEHSTPTTEEPRANPIPSTVLGQAFLKTLVEDSTPVCAESTSKPIPSSVVGQAFLKTLVDHDSPVQESSPSPIPSSVVGQAFLKSLLEQSPSGSQESATKPIPSSVVVQAFLKSLIGEESKAEERAEKAIPAAVLGQSFLKSLLEQGTPQADQPAKDDHGGESKVIPSSVLGQTFLKSLIQEQSPPASPQPTAIPASVIGSAFLKALSDNPTSPSELSDPQTSSGTSEPTMPANVIGQAFLKTLLTMTSGSDSPPVGDQSEPIFPVGSSNQIVRSASDSGHGLNGNSFLDGNQSTSSELLVDPSSLEEGDSIIPPPPEFSGSPLGGSEGGTSGIDVASSEIIGELLSYTRMMQSVIESMKDTASSQSDHSSK